MYNKRIPEAEDYKFSMVCHCPMWDQKSIYEVDRKIRESLAEHIRSKFISEEKQDWCLERRLTVYVFEPNKFWEIVNNEAEKIAERRYLNATNPFEE